MPPTTGPERRLHPASFAFQMGAHLKSLLVPGAAVIFTAGSSGRDWEVWLMVLLIPYTLAAVVRSLSFRYRFDADELVVRRGWVFRSERHIPYARIQNIDVVQNVLHRALGVAEVRVETASGGEPEATMTVLPAAAVAEMRQFVFAGRQSPAGEVAIEEPQATAPPDVLLQLQSRELLLYGFIESRGAVVMAGATGLLWEFGLFDRFLEAGVLRRLARAIAQGAVSPMLIGRTVAAGVALLVVMRLLSMAWAYVRLHGFTVRRGGDDLRVDYGLLTRVSNTIPLQRIQTLTISESPLHRVFARVSVHVDTAGGHGGEAQPRRREPIAPIVGRVDLDSLVAALLPTVTLRGVVWQPPHPRAFRRAFFQTGVVVGVVSVALAFVLRWWTPAASAMLCVWAWIYARRYVAHLGWALSGDAVVFKSGWLWRRVTVARFSKIQAVSRLESPFDRRLEMATVHVDTAGAEHSMEMPFLAAETATALTATLVAHAARTAFRW